jgi:hypothetical protein
MYVCVCVCVCVCICMCVCVCVCVCVCIHTYVYMQAIHYAAYNGHIEACMLLIDMGSDPNSRNCRPNA